MQSIRTNRQHGFSAVLFYGLVSLLFVASAAAMLGIGYPVYRERLLTETQDTLYSCYARVLLRRGDEANMSWSKYQAAHETLARPNATMADLSTYLSSAAAFLDTAVRIQKTVRLAGDSLQHAFAGVDREIGSLRSSANPVARLAGLHAGEGIQALVDTSHERTERLLSRCQSRSDSVASDTRSLSLTMARIVDNSRRQLAEQLKRPTRRLTLENTLSLISESVDNLSEVRFIERRLQDSGEQNATRKVALDRSIHEHLQLLNGILSGVRQTIRYYGACGRLIAEVNNLQAAANATVQGRDGFVDRKELNEVLGLLRRIQGKLCSGAVKDSLASQDPGSAPQLTYVLLTQSLNTSLEGVCQQVQEQVRAVTSEALKSPRSRRDSGAINKTHSNGEMGESTRHTGDESTSRKPDPTYGQTPEPASAAALYMPIVSHELTNPAKPWNDSIKLGDNRKTVESLSQRINEVMHSTGRPKGDIVRIVDKLEARLDSSNVGD